MKVAAVTQSDLEKGFLDLGIAGKKVVIHSSLKSFGYVEGDADTVIRAFIHSFETFLIPAFCWASNAPPPSWDRPLQNGCDYHFYDNWSKPPTPFLVETAGVEKSMGVISQKMIALRGVKRSDHPWHSWAAYGEQADYLVENHPWETTNLPLERLADLGGHVVLIGVGLKSCTAVHVAEEMAGRCPFIRWMTARNGEVKRVRAAGCSKGFDRLMPYCQGLFQEIYIGESRVLTAPLQPLLRLIAEVIRKEPESVRCSPECLRCRDSILGGPIEPKELNHEV